MNRVPKLGFRGNVWVICMLLPFRTMAPILSDSRVYKNEKFPVAAPASTAVTDPSAADSAAAEDDSVNGRRNVDPGCAFGRKPISPVVV